MGKKNQFILNAIVLIATSFIIRTLYVSFSVYISGKIGAEGMGVYQLIMSVYTLAIILTTAGIGMATTRIVAEELALERFENVKACMKRCIGLSLFYSGISALLLFLSADFVVSHFLNNKISAISFYVLSGCLPFIAVSSVLNGYFIAVRRAVKSASEQILEQLIRIGVTVYAFNLIGPSSLEYYCIVLGIAAIVSEGISSIYSFILYTFDKRRYESGKSSDKSIMRRIFQISLPVAIGSCMRSMLDTFKQIAAPRNLKKSGLSFDFALGQYGIIKGMVVPIIMFSSAFLYAFSSLIIPEIAEKYVQKKEAYMNHLISKIFKLVLLFSIGVSGVFMCYSKELSMLIYHKLDTAVYFKIFSPLIVVMYLDIMVDSILKGLNEQNYLVGVNILDATIGVILMYTLLPLYGIKGYLIVFYVTEMVNAVLSVNRLIQKTRFELKIFWWVIMPSLSMILAVFLAKTFIKNNVIIGIGIAGIIYLVLLYLLGIIKKEDLL